MIFPGISGGFQGIATHKYSIKLLIWTVAIFNKLISLLNRFSRKICESNSSLLHDTFIFFYNSAFTPIGHNRYSAHKHQKLYFKEDHICANFVRFLRLSKSSIRDLDVESMIYTVVTNTS